ncbi:1-aminocyclopropane-1-carboxylate oxidase homolog 3-like protein [Tanacetum coccineum]
MSPMEPAWDMVPEICRVSLADWDKAVVDLAEELMSILCEGLGIKSDKLKELSCLEGRVKCGEEWADIEAVPGAIVINIGDVLQMMSNDEYKSVQHRVLANPIKGARVFVAIFFNSSNQEGLYGPFPELISAEKPAVYQEFLLANYLRRFYAMELDEKALTINLGEISSRSRISDLEKISVVNIGTDILDDIGRYFAEILISDLDEIKKILFF